MGDMQRSNGFGLMVRLGKEVTIIMVKMDMFHLHVLLLHMGCHTIIQYQEGMNTHHMEALITHGMTAAATFRHYHLLCIHQGLHLCFGHQGHRLCFHHLCIHQGHRHYGQWPPNQCPEMVVIMNLVGWCELLDCTVYVHHVWISLHKKFTCKLI